MLVPLVVSLSVCPAYAGGFNKAAGLGRGFARQEMALKRQALIKEELERMAPLIKSKANPKGVPRQFATEMAKARADAQISAKWDRVTFYVFLGLTVAEVGWQQYNRLRVENPALLKKIMAQLNPLAKPPHHKTLWQIRAW